jgi:hypothetical protein
MPEGVNRNPRPTPRIHKDLDTRSFLYGRGSIRQWMLKPTFNMPIGIYGTGRYGKCVYGCIVGIYGDGKYGECVYY